MIWRSRQVVVDALGRPVIHENIIKDAREVGIRVKKGGGGEITNNQIVNCRLGIEVM